MSVNQKDMDPVLSEVMAAVRRHKGMNEILPTRNKFSHHAFLYQEVDAGFLNDVISRIHVKSAYIVNRHDLDSVHSNVYHDTVALLNSQENTRLSIGEDVILMGEDENSCYWLWGDSNDANSIVLRVNKELFSDFATFEGRVFQYMRGIAAVWKPSSEIEPKFHKFEVRGQAAW